MREESKPAKPEEQLTSRGEKLSDLRKAARKWAGWEPARLVDAEAAEETELPTETFSEFH